MGEAERVELHRIVLQISYRYAMFCLLNAIPLGTSEKAKACEYRESEICN